MEKTRLKIAAVIVVGALTLQACTKAQVVDNTAETAVFLGKTAVKGVIGAGKLAVRGGKAAIDRARASRAEKADFPAGTPVCLNDDGGYYKALETEDGKLFCLPREGA